MSEACFGTFKSNSHVSRWQQRISVLRLLPAVQGHAAAVIFGQLVEIYLRTGGLAISGLPRYSPSTHMSGQLQSPTRPLSDGSVELVFIFRLLSSSYSYSDCSVARIRIQIAQ